MNPVEERRLQQAYDADHKRFPPRNIGDAEDYVAALGDAITALQSTDTPGTDKLHDRLWKKYERAKKIVAELGPRRKALHESLNAEVRDRVQAKLRLRHNYPLPNFRKVKEVYSDGETVAIIAPDHAAGTKGRFSVLRLYLVTGKTFCIGRELPIGLSRKIAKRPAEDDGLACK